jgi:hypothetical protein
MTGQLQIEGAAPAALSRHQPAAAAPAAIAATERSALRVALLRRVDGAWSANVSTDGRTRTFHRRFGSWQTDRKRTDDWPPRVVRRFASPRVAAALQARVATLERRERRNGG